MEDFRADFGLEKRTDYTRDDIMGLDPVFFDWLKAQFISYCNVSI